MAKQLYTFILIFTLSMTLPSIAQDDTVSVPDLIGMNLPQATALLNTLGLGLGTETAVDLASGNGLPAGAIASQSVDSGTLVSRGTIVNVGVLRSNNVVLIYDDNDLTLLNITNNVANITGLRFAAVEGTSPASFAASRWGSNVREQRCLQLWSVAIRDSKPVSGCQDIQWLSTNEVGEHFWTQTNGVQQFAIIENGVTRTTCPAAPANSQNNPVRCEFYLAGAGSADDLTSYLYLSYTPSSIAIVNQSEDRWMPTDRTTIYNFNPNIEVEGASLIIGDPALFQNPETVADLTKLAPGQCLVLTTDQATATLLEPCDIVAQRALSSSVAFWLADFELESATDGQRRICPAANPERPTICVVPQ